MEMCNWVQLYAKGHEHTWLYAMILVGRFLDEDVRHAIVVDIPKLGGGIGHGTGRECPHSVLIIPIGTHASSTLWHHVQLRRALLCLFEIHNVDNRNWGIFLRWRHESQCLKGTIEIL